MIIGLSRLNNQHFQATQKMGKKNYQTFTWWWSLMLSLANLSLYIDSSCFFSCQHRYWKHSNIYARGGAGRNQTKWQNSFPLQTCSNMRSMKYRSISGVQTVLRRSPSVRPRIPMLQQLREHSVISTKMYWRVKASSHLAEAGIRREFCYTNCIPWNASEEFNGLFQINFKENYEGFKLNTFYNIKA